MSSLPKKGMFAIYNKGHVAVATRLLLQKSHIYSRLAKKQRAISQKQIHVFAICNKGFVAIGTRLLLQIIIDRRLTTQHIF